MNKTIIEEIEERLALPESLVVADIPVIDMSVTAIEARYLCPTNCRGSRVIVNLRNAGNIRGSYCWRDELNGEQNFIFAVLRFLKEKGFDKSWGRFNKMAIYAGHTTSGMMFTFGPRNPNPNL